MRDQKNDRKRVKAKTPPDKAFHDSVSAAQLNVRMLIHFEN